MSTSNSNNEVYCPKCKICDGNYKHPAGKPYLVIHTNFYMKSQYGAI